MAVELAAANDRYTATTPSDFVPVATTIPSFQELHMFEKNSTLSKSAWVELNKTIWGKIKFDLMSAMMTKYSVLVEKEIQY
ncbi:hypothetical protein MRX96_001022 [Rhipicephalus microplus]